MVGSMFSRKNNNKFFEKTNVPYQIHNNIFLKSEVSENLSDNTDFKNINTNTILIEI